MARSGGVFQGGLAFGILFALWYFRRHKIPTWKMADLVVPALALGHGFGRIGCFLAGCCYGTECAAALGDDLPSEYAHDLTGIPLDTPLHPVQLYEAALNFLNFACPVPAPETEEVRRPGLLPLHHELFRHPLLHRVLPRRPRRTGPILLRGPSAFLSVSYPQLFCLIGLLAGVVPILRLRRGAGSKP